MGMTSTGPVKQANIRNAGVCVIEEAREILRKGGPVVYPTSTLYALGVDARNSSAIGLVFELKKRPDDMAISIAITNLGMAREFAVFDEEQQATIQALRALPITFIVCARPDIHDGLIGKDNTTAFRFPQHPVAEALIEGFGPLTTTSANLHGKGDPVGVEEAATQLGPSVPLYIKGKTGKFGRLTTILDIRKADIRIVRRGAATRNDIQAALPGRKVN